jgi:hypothetical protein
MIRTFMGRKFLLASFALVSGAVLGYLGKLTGEYATIVSVVITAFNTADTLITRKSLEKTP